MYTAGCSPEQVHTAAVGLRLVAGDVITIDGATGHVWRGGVENSAPISSLDHRRTTHSAQQEFWRR